MFVCCTPALYILVEEVGRIFFSIVFFLSLQHNWEIVFSAESEAENVLSFSRAEE